MVDYFVGRQLELEENPGTRKRMLVMSMVVNLGFLGFFKYFNFFIDSFRDLFKISNDLSLHIILPVGISF